MATLGNERFQLVNINDGYIEFTLAEKLFLAVKAAVRVSYAMSFTHMGIVEFREWYRKRNPLQTFCKDSGTVTFNS